MRLLVIGDLHGQTVELARDPSEFDAVLATGDFCGDALRGKMFEAMEQDEAFHELMDQDEAREAVDQSLKKGREVLEWLESLGVPVYVVPGNWDWAEPDPGWSFLDRDLYRERLLDGLDNVTDADRELLDIGPGVQLVGYGPCSGPEKPVYEDDMPGDQDERRELEREYQWLREEVTQVFKDADERLVFLSHNVPHDTPLDRVRNEDSPAHGRHYGSLVVREMIEEFQPAVSVAGHMHEGEGTYRIGATTCLNAGLRRQAVVELADGDVEIEFVG